MAYNRLKLDFTIQSMSERRAFVDDMLSHPPYLAYPPTAAECETIGSYILWGKDDNGLNAKQAKDVQLESKAHTWDAAKREESLDALRESPSFCETSLRKLGDTPMKQQRALFSRKQARENAPDYLLPVLEDLWRQIDELDLMLCYYDLEHGRRTSEPRDVLLARFTNDEQIDIKLKAAALSQFKYLKLRHLLVELRQQQYTLSDSWIENHLPETTSRPILVDDTTQFYADVAVAPLGLKCSSNIWFSFDRLPTYYDFENNPNLGDYLQKYWEQKDAMNVGSGDTKFLFDFRNPQHLYQLFQQWDAFGEQIARGEFQHETTAQVIDTLEFYMHAAELDEVQQKILDMKIQNKKNQDIADIINRKFDKSYNANYISTIFCQKIIPQIARAAQIHQECVENICFKENWKICRRCGRVLLLNTDNFMRKSRSSDGYASRCKRCDKEVRQLKKQQGEQK